MKNITKIIALLLIACFAFTSCSSLANVETDNGDLYAAEETSDASSQSSNNIENLSEETENELLPAPETYNEGVVLVKCDEEEKLNEYSFASTNQLYGGSEWYLCELAEGEDTAETVEYLRTLDVFDEVDFDYIMGVGAEVESVDISGNPDHGKQNDTFKTHHIKEGWDYLKKNGYNPGGSSDVVVAVIDTGVDYSHLDLRNNIWVNSAEIPDNGKDDDGNGYIDDLCGWNFVGDNKDPMDDNGHGTHVAGIIAAEDNKEGGVGVAYNCKVMVLKAGNSSGYFNNSDIAEAIQYAYMNGADVINMSFSGSYISLAVKEALEEAYNTSILVAAAGNDSLCNQPGCLKHVDATAFYPAAFPYVIGVMSTQKDGKHLSSFSNYDHKSYGSIEYEVYAVGEGVYSTWPNNKYATLNGTSMATPMVSGIAALLRSYYSDREVYSTKFIQSQIVNTGTVNPHIIINGEHVTDEAHSVVDVLDALTKYPKPSVNLYDYYFDDSISISNMNNGNGVIDAGETVRLYISLHNRGGVASNVNVSIDTYRRTVGDEEMTDPYFTFVNSTMLLSDIGTYSVRDSSTSDNYFEIIVDSKCPNDYFGNFNIRYTYENGLDSEDKTVYEDDGEQQAQFKVSNGYHLPKIISESVRYTADKLYIVSQTTTIPKGVSVVFEEGCRIQFDLDLSGESTDPKIKVYGDLGFQGSRNNMIELFTSSTTGYGEIWNQGSVCMEYINATDIKVFDQWQPNSIYVCNSILKSSNENVQYEFDIIEGCTILFQGKKIKTSPFLSANCIMNSYIAVPTDGTINTKQSQNSIFVSLPPYSSTKGYISLNGGTNNGLFNNNAFISLTNKKDCLHELRLSSYGWNDNNHFSEGYRNYAETAIVNYITSTGQPSVNVYSSLSAPYLLWPHVVSVEMFDKDGNPITAVGREEIKVRVTFNRPMDVNAGTFMTFGTIEPYGDYRIDGEYISDTVWEGTYTLKAQIENGQNFLMVNNAWAAEDQTKTVFGEYQLHEFTIDTTAAMSMNLQANPTENGIELNFVQDDYDTLLGYNVYRSTEKDGNYVKLNPAILLPNELTFIDENAEPGKTYWYTYTVVLTDFTESNPAGKVQATAMDTMAPSLYHTPVNQGYMNNNLVITCTASDNVGIQSVILYYRAVGASEWKTLEMGKQSDKFSAKIYGNELTLDGIEYYIVAYDELNSIAKGSAEAPYTVVIKDASAISRKGDVDGDGVVTTKDALMLMQHINETKLLTDDEFKRADLNGDGVLNSSEALRILQYINGKVNTLEM